MPRALGDTFASGELKADRMADIMDAADILEAAIAFDENPPFEAKYLLAYWEHRAGILGRLWARRFPPAIVRRLRMQMASEFSHRSEERSEGKGCVSTCKYRG